MESPQGERISDVKVGILMVDQVEPILLEGTAVWFDLSENEGIEWGLDIFDWFERLLGTDRLVSPLQPLWQEPESFLVTHLLGKAYFFPESVL